MTDPWIPFEDRPRPPGLGRVLLGLDRVTLITITSENEQDIGEVFAWLFGQAELARRANGEAK